MTIAEHAPDRMHRNKRVLGALIMTLAMLGAAGCGTTTMSKSGGIVPLDEGFSITVPRSETLEQGTGKTIAILLNRGAYFKRDVLLDIYADGISVTPTSVLIKASEKPELPCQIRADRQAALGDYRVTVTGTPETGKPTSTVFVVKVVAQ